MEYVASTPLCIPINEDGTADVRFLDKAKNTMARLIFSNWWKEQISAYGIKVLYSVYNFNPAFKTNPISPPLSSIDTTQKMNFIYGEQPTAEYKPAVEMVILVDLSNDSIMLSKFGIMSDADLTAVIHIGQYEEKFGIGVEPKSGDLITMSEYGDDRPNGRGAEVFEITERLDQTMSMQVNQLMGHYVWVIKCKRFEYSYQKNAPKENKNDQISDNSEVGILAGFAQLSSTNKIYDGTVDVEADQNFNYTSESVNNSIYGNY
jgi:hypothetical protein